MNDSYNEHEPSFSLNDFKKWMASQTDKPTRKSRNHAEIVGTMIESKIGVKRLMSKMLVDEGDVRELAEDFKEHGGVVVDSDKDEILLIEVDSGTFMLPKFFVRKAT
jgi:hypothetical protein